MSRVPSILLKIKKCLNVCGTSITDLLNEYAGSTSSVISSNQLARALNDCGANISPIEIQELEIEFKYGNGISISALIAAIGNLNQTKESNPHSECFNELILLSKKLKLHNQTIVDCLKPYDRNNRGFVSVNDFIRCFGNSIESQKIVKSFMNPETKLINLQDIYQSVGIAMNSVMEQQKKEITKSVNTLIMLVIQKRIDIQSIFQSYDKIRCGKIPKETFVMLITSIGASQLLPQEIQEISQYYHDSNGLINYVRFCQDIESAYQRTSGQQRQAQPPSQNNINVQAVMNRLKKTIIERRISIFDLFPKTKTGKLSQYVFSRILSQNNLGLSNQEILSITLYFTDSPQSQQEVDYQRFLSFFAEKRVEKPFADIKLILEKIAHLSTVKRANLKGTLLRFDRDGSNIMPAFQFIVALQYIGINLNPNEVNEICRVFPGNYQNSVSLQSFICAVSPYVQKEESLLKTQNATNEEQNTTPAQDTNKKEGPPPQVILDIVNKISYAALRKEISLIDDFRNIDKARHNTIKKNSYFEYITSLSAGLSVSEIRMLFEYYIKNADEFDYATFIDDANNCIRSRVGNSNTLTTARATNSNSSSINENVSPELQSILYRIRAIEIKKMLYIGDLFSPYDQMKNGTVPCKAVNAILVNVGLLLKNSEIDLLIKHYQDSLNKDMFHYRALASIVSSIKLSNEKADRILYPEFFEAEMERELYSVRPEIKEKLHVRRKNAYLVYSNVNGTTISEEEFFNRLSNAGIIIMKTQREAIMKHYSNPSTGEINYKKFCEDVENSSPISI